MSKNSLDVYKRQVEKDSTMKANGKRHKREVVKIKQSKLKKEWNMAMIRRDVNDTCLLYTSCKNLKKIDTSAKVKVEAKEAFTGCSKLAGFAYITKHLDGDTVSFSNNMVTVSYTHLRLTLMRMVTCGMSAVPMM